jgi:hypothetical protein
MFSNVVVKSVSSCVVYCVPCKYVVMILVLLTPILERGAMSKGGLGT